MTKIFIVVSTLMFSQFIYATETKTAGMEFSELRIEKTDQRECKIPLTTKICLGTVDTASCECANWKTTTKTYDPSCQAVEKCVCTYSDRPTCGRYETEVYCN